MTKSILYACVLSSFVTFSAFAEDVPTKPVSTNEVPTIQENVKDPLAGCGCKDKDKNKAIACCGEEEDFPKIIDDQNIEQACGKCGRNHVVLASNEKPATVVETTEEEIESV